MTQPPITGLTQMIAQLSPETPVLIAGPTASGKSALALEIAARQGGVIVNADASQVYDCWRVITARPSAQEETMAPHCLYGHVAARDAYSAGHWLRDVAPLIKGTDRPIIVGGTGLYFTALTRGLADIPKTPPDIRVQGDGLPLDALLTGLDPQTKARIDTANRARVQRAWEVLQATGRSLASWQDETGAPLLPPAQAEKIVIDAPKEWLNGRVAERFDQMIAAGALDEARHVHPDYDPALPAHRAIGVPELMAHLQGQISLGDARDRAVIATRQFAKRQRTWFRSKMHDWQAIRPQ